MALDLKLSYDQEGRSMRHVLKEDRNGIGTKVSAGNREGNLTDNAYLR